MRRSTGNSIGRKCSPHKQWKSKSRIFIVWNSETIGFDFTEKSLYFIEKHKRKLLFHPFLCVRIEVRELLSNKSRFVGHL